MEAVKASLTLGLNETDTSKLSFLEKLKRQPIFRERILFTAAICWSFIMLGWVESLLGPTFPDLRLIIGETLDASSGLFTATSGGFLVGSVLTGAIYDRYNTAGLLLLSILGTAGTVAAIPWCPYLALMLAVKFLSGLTAASLDTGGNAEVVNIWDKQAGPYMQALHFCFSLGGMIAPLMAQPFLATKIRTSRSEPNSSQVVTFLNVQSQTSVTNNTLPYPIERTSASFAESDVWLNQTKVYIQNVNNSDTLIDTLDVYSETRVHYAYLITAGLILITAIPFACIVYIKRENMQHIKPVSKRIEQSDFDLLPVWKKLVILSLLSSLMVVYCGTEDTFAGFLMTFTISQLNWSKSAGSVATSVHWICFGLARLGAIFVVRFVRTSILLYTFSIMLAVSFSCLLVASLADIAPLVWVFIGCSGFSMSVIFPAIFTWTNENVVPVSGKISAMFLTSSSLGVMLCPLLFGYTMDRLAPIWFLYLLLGQSITWVILFTGTLIVAKTLIKSKLGQIEIEIAERETIQIDKSATNK